MQYKDDGKLIEAVIRHCEFIGGKDNTYEALRLAKINGYIDEADSLTYSGRTIAVMMLIDFNKYQKYFGLTMPKQPDFQHAAG